MAVKENEESNSAMRKYHEQMLKLVAKGFYNELINYGVEKADVLSVAGHLLDNVMVKGPTNKLVDYYNRLFTIKDVQNDWATTKSLTLQQVTIAPMDPSLIPRIATWLRTPAIRESFYPRFPDSEAELGRYFLAPTREYCSIFYQQQFAGIIGAENIDTESARLEMRKLVGDPGMHGKGIGKRATFLFLYHVFMVRKFKKVYLHSLDINIRNLNLNGKFGFELEGVFLEEARIQDRWRDVIRMALAAPVWLELFS
ncbi:MAG: Protein N-acetyltransferase, RimJ/RimL family [Pedosphaera sp.]|nr:Protein N-acetyltransferase, RimJ/RimL family [Pedosphaera sp.]